MNILKVPKMSSLNSQFQAENKQSKPKQKNNRRRKNTKKSEFVCRISPLHTPFLGLYIAYIPRFWTSVRVGGASGVMVGSGALGGVGTKTSCSIDCRRLVLPGKVGQRGGKVDIC